MHNKTKGKANKTFVISTLPICMHALHFLFPQALFSFLLTSTPNQALLISEHFNLQQVNLCTTEEIEEKHPQNSRLIHA